MQPSFKQGHFPRARVVRLLPALAALAASHVAPAATLNWNNAAGGAASTAANWSPAQIPTSADDLVFNLNATFTITYNASATASRTHTYRTGTVTMSATTPHSASTGITVGSLSGDNATLTLTTGTLTSNAAVVVGNTSGATGRINVNDDDASLIVANGADFTVGNSGPATLSITNSGFVEVADQFFAGSNSTSTTTVTISGSQIAPIASSFLDVLGTSQSRIGAGGDVTMTVESGGVARFAGDVVIANGAASTSSITVQTAGPLLNSRLDIAGDLLIGRNTSATAAGNGTLSVNTGGTALVDGQTLLGDVNGGTGTLNFGGGTFAGTTIDVLAGSLISGNGTINADINNAGAIAPSGAGLTIDGVLSNTTNGISGTSLIFGPGGGYLGSGACLASISGDTASSITATGPLTLGRAATNGVSYNGTLDVGGEDVTLIDSNGAVLGGQVLLDGGELSCTNGLGFQFGSAVSGRGTLVGNVTNSGRLEPVGNPGSNIITIQGNYVANPSSDLTMDLAGPNSGTPRVNVTGTATFGGNAELSLAPGYLPTLGQQMILINATGGRSDTFDSLEHTNLCDQYTLVLVYSSTAAIALVRPGLQVTAVGDIDRDGDVDAADFQRWAPCMAGPDVLVRPVGCDAGDFQFRADLDGPACDDYDVDMRDLAVLQRIL